MKYFTNCKSLDELKAEFRRLTKIHHPDLGGTQEEMKRVNADYTEAFEILKACHNAQADEAHQTTETPEEFRAIVEALIRMEGVEVELCGSWLWISGNTFPHREELKRAGCRWSKSKKLWYWRHLEDSLSGWHRGTATMAKIRERYGSQILGRGETPEALPA